MNSNSISSSWVCSSILLFAAAILLFSSSVHGLVQSVNHQNNSIQNGVPKAVPLNVHCRRSTDCGTNAFCNQTHLCQCDLGFIASDTTNCKQYTCVSEQQCSSLFGNGTRCKYFWKTQQCVCDDSFQLDPLTQTCRPFKQQLNQTCAYAFQCGKNTACVSGQCKCQFGYTPSKWNKMDCDMHTCRADQDCAPFGNHSTCFTLASTCQCATSSGWVLNQNTQSCAPQAKLLNQTCYFDSDCGSGAICGDGKCRCSLGYLPDQVGGINCNSYRCSSNYDCAARFDPHATCQYNLCSCDNPGGWQLRKHNQTCEQRAQYVGGSCSFSSNCGYNSDCINGACHCQFGYAPKPNGMDCSLLSCSFNSECEALDVNSECFGSTCMCKDGFMQDFVLDRCVSIDGGFNSFMAVFGVVFGSILILAGVVLILIVLVSRRAQRRGGYIQKS